MDSLDSQQICILFINYDDNQFDSFQCPICVSYYSQSRKPMMTNCSHNICNQCISKLNKKCICRQIIQTYNENLALLGIFLQQPVQCPFVTIGCQYTCKLEQLQFHLKNDCKHANNNKTRYLNALLQNEFQAKKAENKVNLEFETQALNNWKIYLDQIVRKQCNNKEEVNIQNKVPILNKVNKTNFIVTDVNIKFIEQDWKSTSQKCTICLIQYTTVNREHHCRICAKSCCKSCSGQKVNNKKVCNACFYKLENEEENETYSKYLEAFQEKIIYIKFQQIEVYQKNQDLDKQLIEIPKELEEISKEKQQNLKIQKEEIKLIDKENESLQAKIQFNNILLNVNKGNQQSLLQQLKTLKEQKQNELVIKIKNEESISKLNQMIQLQQKKKAILQQQQQQNQLHESQQQPSDQQNKLNALNNHNVNDSESNTNLLQQYNELYSQIFVVGEKIDNQVKQLIDNKSNNHYTIANTLLSENNNAAISETNPQKQTIIKSQIKGMNSDAFDCSFCGIQRNQNNENKKDKKGKNQCIIF